MIRTFYLIYRLTRNPTSLSLFRLELQQLKHLENAIQQAKNSEAKKEYRQASYYYKVASQAAVADKNLHINHIKNTALAGQVMDAHKMIFDVLQKNSNDANAILVRGICFHLEDNTEKALTHFSQALRLAPDLTEAKTYRMICKKIKEVKEKGNACFKEQNYTQAIEVYTEALTIDPPNRACNAKLLFNRALARSKIKETDPDKAEARDRLIKKDCDSAIEFDEKYVKAYRRRALVNQNLGEHDQAVRDFETVAKLEPTRENKQAVQQAKKQAKLAERKDYYKILDGVEKSTNFGKILGHSTPKFADFSNLFPLAIESLKRRRRKRFKKGLQENGFSPSSGSSFFRQRGRKT